MPLSADRTFVQLRLRKSDHVSRRRILYAECSGRYHRARGRSDKLRGTLEWSGYLPSALGVRMNQNSKAARFLIALSAALLVVSATWFVRHPSDATRTDPTRSLRADIQKSKRLESSSKEKELTVSKVSSTFSLSIIAESTTPTLHLKGRITAARPIESHEFSWILPRGYRILSGASSGSTPAS